MNQDTGDHRLRPASLGVADIVFFVVAAAAPLGATVGGAPVVFAAAGRGVPALYVTASLVLVLFAIGFAAMSRKVVSAGGFAEFVTVGLGKIPGDAAGGIALFAYLAMLLGINAQLGTMASYLLATWPGWHIDWRIATLVSIFVVGFFGYKDVNLSAKVLGVVMIFEVLILLLFDAAVLLTLPRGEVNLTGFRPSEVLSAGMVPALMFSFSCFVGFESTTIYGEEARTPEVTIPRATYIAIGTIGIFYSLTMWCIGLAYQNEDVRALAAADPVNFVFAANTRLVGGWATDAMAVLVVTSVFAVLLSFHNALGRYMFALARRGFLPAALGHIHPQNQSPFKASLVLTLTVLLIMGIMMVLEIDPVRSIYPILVGVGTLGILVLQALAAMAVISFFRGEADRSWWTGLAAPLLGGAGLWLIVALAIRHFGFLTGVESGPLTLVPWLVLVAALLGIVRGVAVRHPHAAG